MEHQQQLVTSFICDNESIVNCIIKYYDTDMAIIKPEATEGDIILPTIRFSKAFNSTLERHRGHVERLKEDRHQWMTNEASNIEVDKIAG